MFHLCEALARVSTHWGLNVPPMHSDDCNHECITHYGAYRVIVSRCLNISGYLVTLMDPTTGSGFTWNVVRPDELTMVLITLWERMDRYDVSTLDGDNPINDIEVDNPLV
jgi:hypothetical protein